MAHWRHCVWTLDSAHGGAESAVAVLSRDKYKYTVRQYSSQYFSGMYRLQSALSYCVKCNIENWHVGMKIEIIGKYVASARTHEARTTPWRPQQPERAQFEPPRRWAARTATAVLHLQADGALPLRSGLLLLLTTTSTRWRLQLLRTHEDSAKFWQNFA